MEMKIQGLSKTYSSYSSQSQTKAVEDVSLQIPQGSIFGVIGKSGAGKSTLLRMMSLLETPDAGEVFYDDIRVDNLCSKDLIQKRRQIGMIFQSFNLFSSRNAFSNIAYPMEITKTYSKQQIKNRVSELLDLVGLNDKAKSPISKLSGGQKQRIGIARALACRPQVLFCDEATSALDPQTTKSILELLKQIQRQMNLTIVMITHQMEVVKDACDMVAVMDQGRIVEEGKTQTLFSHPQSPVTKDFLQRLPFSDTNISRWSNEGGKYVLHFKDNLTDEPVMSRLAKRFDVELNIRAGGVQKVGLEKIGTMLVDMKGSDVEVKKALEYLRACNVSYELAF